MSIGLDGFHRTTAYGLGTGFCTYTWDGRDTSFATAADSIFYVDGETVVIPASGSAWDSYTLTSFTSPKRNGWLSFDIFLPAIDPSSGGTVEFWPALFVRSAWTDEWMEMGVFIEQDYSHTDALYLTVCQTATGAGRGYSVGPLTGDLWYTLKVQWDVGTAGNGPGDGSSSASYKFWERGTAEPDWQYTTAADDFNSPSFTDTWLDFYYGGTSLAYLDNLQFGDTDFHGLTLDSYISGLTTPHFTIEAALKATQTGSFTIDALIPFPALTIDAFIVGAILQKHFRDRDHTGTLGTTYVLLDSAVGQFGVGSNLNEIFTYLVAMVPEWSSYSGGFITYPTETVRNRHSRLDDHVGLAALSNYYLAADLGNPPAIGSYAAGTSLADVLDGLLGSIDGHTFTIDAVVQGTVVSSGQFLISARIGSFSSIMLDALLRATRTGTFTMDAIVSRTVLLDAILLKSRNGSLTMDALLARGIRVSAVLKKTRTGASQRFTIDAVVVL